MNRAESRLKPIGGTALYFFQLYDLHLLRIKRLLGLFSWLGISEP